MTTAELTTDPFFDFREKLTIMCVLEMITYDNARRIVNHVEERYPHGNPGYCQIIIDALSRDIRQTRSKPQ